MATEIANSEIEGPVSSFQSYAAEGDILAKQCLLSKAIEMYGKALQLRPGDKNCLVVRSKCYLQLGDPVSALKDANASLKEEKDFFKGIFQKAEALYAVGDFEMALVFYHRGNKQRPEFNDFRLGIQKASEAINNSIGNPNNYKFQAPQNKNVKFATINNTAITSISPEKDASSIVPQIQKRDASESYQIKQLLGELYTDRVYLEDLLQDKDFITNPNQEVTKLVTDAILYLEKRTEFWRQQKPIYARKKEHGSILAKANAAKTRRLLREKESRQKEKLQVESKDGKNIFVQKLSIANPEQKNINAVMRAAYKAYEKKDFDSSIELVEALLVRLDEVPDQDQKNYGLGECYGLLGMMYLEMGSFAQAVLYHKKDLSIALENKFLSGQKRAYGNLGKSYVTLKRYREASKMFQARLELVGLDNNKSNTSTSNSSSILDSTKQQQLEFIEMAWLLHDISRCHVELKQLTVAIEYAKKALEEAKNSKDLKWILNTQMLVAQLHDRLDESNKAHSLFSSAFDIARDLDDRATQANIISNMEIIEDNTEFNGSKVSKGMRVKSADSITGRSSNYYTTSLGSNSNKQNPKVLLKSPYQSPQQHENVKVKIVSPPTAKV